MNVCIFGASSAKLDEVFYTEAQRLGELLAGNGYGLVFGGGREGLMGAAARGAAKFRGEIIGIAPKFFDEPGILYEGCTELIFTDTMRERKQLMEEKSDACIVLPGGIGTYEELFEILTLKQLGKTRRAIVFLNTDGYYAPLLSLLEHTAKRKFMSENCLSLFSVAASPEDAIEALKTYVPISGDLTRLEDYNK